MTTTGAEPTYDDLVRWYLRVIASCEMEKARLRAQLLVLQVQILFAEFLDPERAEELEALIRAIKAQIEELDRLEEAARQALRDLRRDHGPVRWARADSPAGGAEKAYYTGTGAQ